MRTVLLLLLSLLPTLALSQAALRIACRAIGFSECYCDCIVPLISSYCPLDPLVCPCTNSGYLSAATTCVFSNCTTSEVQSARLLAEKECSSNGAPLPSTVLMAPATAGTTAGTATVAVSGYESTDPAARSTGTPAGSSGAPVSEGKKGGLGAGAIAGIVIGVVSGIAAGAGIMYLLLRRGRQSQAPQPPSPPPVLEQASQILPDKPLDSGRVQLPSNSTSPPPSNPPTSPPAAELYSPYHTLAPTQPPQYHGDAGNAGPLHELPHR